MPPAEKPEDNGSYYGDISHTAALIAATAANNTTIHRIVAAADWL